ncbi:MAG: RNA-directed DNA polymerase, partial [Actinomycetota bacterium]|nr:RNA-directed DNA polymerase [Actinomycetota bacterium]
LGLPPDSIRRAAGLLEGWGSQGYAGLPIGPDASAVLGNALLLGCDATLAPFRFLRWVDDYLVALPAVSAAGEVLDRLDHALDGLGLSLAPAKTAVVEGGAGLRWVGTSIRG